MFNLYTGLPGSGKTLLMTLALYPFLIKGYNVYSDYFINFKGDNLKYFNNLEDIIEKRNCILAIDEISALLEPRNWENESMEVRRMFSQHRKRHLTLFSTTQHISLVAKSARIILDYWAEVKNYTPTEGRKGKRGFGSYLPFLLIREQVIPKNKYQEEDIVLKSNFLDLPHEMNYVSKKVNILAPQYDKYKKELKHLYCNECKQSQSEHNRKRCLKCKTKLVYRKSGLYDTDREVYKEETRDLKTIKYYNCGSCGKKHYVKQ